MKLGLQKLSLVDYPGRVACVLFLPGCNFACPYCHNPELLSLEASADLVSLETALSHLGRRQGVISAAVISGGEPLLRPDIPALVSRLRHHAVLVKLDTNGSFPERIGPAGVDYLALDIKTSPARYPELWPAAPTDAADRIMESIRLVRALGKPYEFRITCAPGIFGLDEARQVAALLRPEDPVYLQRCQKSQVLDPVWAESQADYSETELAGLLSIIRQAAPSARLRGS
ncbi:MAG: anaerobic ribonucleoside-triphosphate reductase activating protein [Spirochaetes bacterium GWD1_61_31]|nr:MAG: anaerobic ribonucleoside-triphosphate reductase activating protein [Spirochaetes bacterium GWB1_60_80]OHD30157.1 MAG: anaerobic ribonucleoside-triphosphate reductase activating protein [Spirochaetes bacterium GWC1_61_12]OHD34588.1 MAG: anaerobic ribonucleoside-triphosphate reductase activating protein [Spirochaetes bacterium GWD1_61_31]OHD46404.1 MAG: anaerobic ribonucleoside-triphosphate reductase activating protein [Spirochaetes bacterium GWE1_60_18]OHD59460.1 MAG: anaerobic ribonucle